MELLIELLTEYILPAAFNRRPTPTEDRTMGVRSDLAATDAAAGFDGWTPEEHAEYQRYLDGLDADSRAELEDDPAGMRDYFEWRLAEEYRDVCREAAAQRRAEEELAALPMAEPYPDDEIPF